MKKSVRKRKQLVDLRTLRTFKKAKGQRLAKSIIEAKKIFEKLGWE